MFRGCLLKSGWVPLQMRVWIRLCFLLWAVSLVKFKHIGSLLISCNHSKGYKHSLRVASTWGGCHEWLGKAEVGLRETNFMHGQSGSTTDCVMKAQPQELLDGKTVQRTRSKKLAFYQLRKLRPPEKRLAQWQVGDENPNQGSCSCVVLFRTIWLC